MTHTYISILRGINVSGQKQIKMDALKKCYESLGFENVSTYVQSGNVIFSAGNPDTGELAKTISDSIRASSGFDVPVLVMEAGYLKRVIDNNPFAGDDAKDQRFMHVTFLASAPMDFDPVIFEDKKQDGEEIAFGDRVVYLYCPNGYGRTKLNNNFLESKLNVTATTRNWKTTTELYRLAGE